jgi:hypothetical protein
MFELCDRLFGIYKVHNCTSAAYISPELLEIEEKKIKTRPGVQQACTTQATKTTGSIEPQQPQNEIDEQENIA